jgi:Carboxypeptidase regulatory-like domain
MPMRTAMVLLSLVLAPLAAAEVLEGTVSLERSPLPGCTITLTSPYASYSVTSNGEGFFRFPDVRPGSYEIRYELPGLKTIHQSIEVWRKTVAPPQEMKAFRTECGTQICSAERPATMFDAPLCTDLELHTNLIDALEAGDRSALALIRQRYETADTYREKHRLAGVLIEHMPNDEAVWNELAKQASIALRDPGNDADEDYDVRQMSISALYVLSESPRSRAMLHEALRSTDAEVAGAAVFGFAWQRETAALPAIDAALARAGEAAREMALGLALYRSEQADAIAFKYIAEGNRESYLELRKAQK